MVKALEGFFPELSGKPMFIGCAEAAPRHDPELDHAAYTEYLERTRRSVAAKLSSLDGQAITEGIELVLATDGIVEDGE